MGSTSTQPQAAGAAVNKPLVLSSDPAIHQVSPEEALRQASAELDMLIGLPEVKTEVKRLMSFLTVQQERQRHGLQAATQSLHFVFTGNPGTGKTTVARILGSIFYGFGILKSAKLVECDRAKVVGSYLGQTAIKTDEVIQSALDGVLFIDEAYTLAGDAAKYGNGDMYGDEAINTILKRMEDFRSRLVVIAAGYPQLMQKFLRSNPGLESRFTRFINFDDYSVPDLCRIFDSFCRAGEYTLTPEACVQAYLLFAVAHSQRDERFGNARYVRNVYEQVVSRQSDRVAHAVGNIDKTELVTLEGQDVPRLPANGLDPQAVNFTESRWEGVCPGCAKATKGGVKYLGQRVSCKCGKKFVFPWWCPVANSVQGVPASLMGQVVESDKVGVIAAHTKPNPQPGPVIKVVEAAARPRAKPERKPGESMTNSLGMKLVWIPPGKFLMGSPKNEPDRLDKESQHEVELTQGFYMSVGPVTQEEYAKVMKVTPSYFWSSGGGKDQVVGMDTKRFPVEQVSWFDAIEFCRRLSEIDDGNYNLPTEAEWEYACRAGSLTAYHFGGNC